MGTQIQGAIIGETGEPFAERCASMLQRYGPYEVIRTDSRIAFRLPPRFRAPLSLVRASNWLNRQALPSFSVAGILQAPATSTVDRFRIKPEDIPGLSDLLSQYKGIHLFNKIAKTVFYSSFAQTTDVLARGIGPRFFSEYPAGRVLALWGDEALHAALAALRVMGAAIDLAERDFERFLQIPELRLMGDAQNSGVFYAGKHLSMPVALFLPRMYGFVASKVTLAFLLLLDTPIPEVRTPFPRSGLELVRGEVSGLFREDLDIDPAEVTPGLIDRFSLLDVEFSISDFRSFIRQYVRHLSSFAAYMINPSFFVTEDSSIWAGLEHYRAWLSVERILDEVILMLTDDTSYLRKAALFRILDQLASLGTSSDSEQAGLFRALAVPLSGQTDPIAQGLSLYRGAIGSHLESMLPALRDELIRVSLASVYVPGLVDQERATVRVGDGSTMQSHEYAAEYVRELRNTEHAYYTRKFNRILAISSGNLPESLPALGALAYLALIARPDLFIQRQWARRAA